MQGDASAVGRRAVVAEMGGERERERAVIVWTQRRGRSQDRWGREERLFVPPQPGHWPAPRILHVSPDNLVPRSSRLMVLRESF